MKSLCDPAAVAEIKGRLALLTPESHRLWGKMGPAQMLAHCSASFEVPLGDKSPPQVMIGRLIGWMFKSDFIGDKEMRRNSPTDPSFIIGGECDFAAEQARLLTFIDRFAAADPAVCAKQKHSFFGKLTGAEWGLGMYKHLDHHLRQFGL
jgi:Protein of unknown function (DUF1569)